jgi:hypothetical protein
MADLEAAGLTYLPFRGYERGALTPLMAGMQPVKMNSTEPYRENCSSICSR